MKFRLLNICILLLYISLNTCIGQLKYRIEKIAGGFEFTEGPVWINSDDVGYLLFSDVSADKIYKWSEKNGISVYIENTGNSNGLEEGNNGSLLLAQQGRRQIGIFDSGEIAALVSEYKGKKFNSPNDIAIRKTTGTIFFTDPPYGIEPKDEELGFHGVYYVPDGSKEAILLTDSLKKPNGIAFSPDYWVMYVCDSDRRQIIKYELRLNNEIKKSTVFASLNAEIDGIKTDLDGNVYVAAANEGIKIFNSEGVLISSVDIPEKTRNLCFGGPYKNKLFVAAGESIYLVTLNPENPFILNELLGKPTDVSVTLNMLAEKDIELYVKYGNNPDSLEYSTNAGVYKAGFPIELSLGGLNAGTKYYYRVCYKIYGEQDYIERDLHFFNTQRPMNEKFVFDIQSDPHLDISSNYLTYNKAIENTIADKPDFLIDLGDNFLSDKLPVQSYKTIVDRMFLFRHFYDKVSHSVPLYLVLGNHEAECGWELNGTEENIAVWNTKARKLYYPNPSPDGFYTGDEIEYPLIGNRESYYSWTWGDALFIVLDPYWHTTNKPTTSKDSWDWTLGKVQYDWLKTTLENSSSKFKFIFCHQLIGGNDYGRGGTEYVDLYEMGGNNKDSSYGFDVRRPGWDKPIHQLFIEYGVNIFFHGHDHLFVKQEKDGVIYQLAPQPSLYNYSGTEQAEEYGYSGTIYPNSGHIKVTVGPDSATIDYIRAYHENNIKKNEINGKIEYSYSVYPRNINSASPFINIHYPAIIATPNPGSEFIVFELNIPESDNVDVTILDYLGNKIKEFQNIKLTNIKDIIKWDLTDNYGIKVSGGIYFCRLNSVSGCQAIKVIVVQ